MHQVVCSRHGYPSNAGQEAIQLVVNQMEIFAYHWKPEES
jgi:hypothetical protein